METEFQNATGKGIGEVMRDIADFLSTPFVIHREKQIDLCSLVGDLNMHEQFSAPLRGGDPGLGGGDCRKLLPSCLHGSDLARDHKCNDRRLS